MNEIKLFEVRDALTYIPVIAIKLDKSDYLVRRSGYNRNHFIVGKLTDDQLVYIRSANDWDNRTLREAHSNIVWNWEDLRNGDVIDVEFLLGETTIQKDSERNS